MVTSGKVKEEDNENQVGNSISGRGEGDGILVHPRLGQAVALEVKLLVSGYSMIIKLRDGGHCWYVMLWYDGCVMVSWWTVLA